MFPQKGDIQQNVKKSVLSAEFMIEIGDVGSGTELRVEDTRRSSDETGHVGKRDKIHVHPPKW